MWQKSRCSTLFRLLVRKCPADILSWSRSQGLFAGVALEGATLREDLDDNATLYGRNWRTARL
jgi:lipid-binding SYLF domain-containing protein